MDTAAQITLLRAQAALEKASTLLRSLQLYDGIDCQAYGIALDARLEVASALGMLGYYTKQREAA